MTKQTFWAHGITAQARYPERTKTLDRDGTGLRVLQADGVNWFYVPLPTPIQHDDDRVDLVGASIRGQLGLGTRITETLLLGGPPAGATLASDPREVRDANFVVTVRHPPATYDLSWPLAVAIHVEFRDPQATVLVHGAGVTVRT